MTSLSIRTVHEPAGFAAVADYFSDVWQTPRSAPPLLPETLNSLAHAGGAVHAGYDGASVFADLRPVPRGEPLPPVERLARYFD